MTTSVEWSDDAFFETPEPVSIDGGTTSSGDLWHSISPRWGHAMHSMCSYYGMFPARVAHYFIQRYTQPNDVVLDPFSGRGTTGLQARVEGRRTISNDLSPLAYVLSKAKVAPPSWEAIQAFIDGLEASYNKSSHDEPDVSADIKMLFHERTLKQLYFIRERLLSQAITKWNPTELMVAGSLAGIMHGSWRRDDSSQYLSISMPNTFSMSPTYVEKYIRENGLRTIDQNVFDRLRDKIARLYVDEISGPDGQAFHLDAAGLLAGNELEPDSVDLVLTSPPYLQVVNYGASNWIRLWLLGLDDVGRDGGAGRKQLDEALDHRHTYTTYKEFILRTVLGMQRVLKESGVAVLVIGDVADPGKSPVPLAAKVWEEIADLTGLRLVDIVEDHLPVQNKVSRIWGDTKGQATTRDCALVLAPKFGVPKTNDSEVKWSEPYKDAGPDAAHERVRAVRTREAT